MAVIFGTSIDNIMESRIKNNNIDPTIRRLDFDSAIDNMKHWGVVGIDYPNAPRMYWYPITKSQVVNIYKHLNEDEVDWVNIITLNNRLLSVNSEMIRTIKLCNDDADPLEGQDIRIEDYYGQTIELYKVLSLKPYANEFGQDWTEDCSEQLLAIANQFIEDLSLEDDDSLQQKLRYTTIHLKGHRPISYWANDKQLSKLVRNVEENIVPRFINIDTIDGQLENFYQANQVYMLEMPLIELIDNFKSGKNNIHNTNVVPT